LQSISFQQARRAASHREETSLRRWQVKLQSFYKSVGQTSARIITMSDTSISTEYSMVRVRWGVTFRKTKDKLIEFDITYFIQKTGPEPKIIMFIAHEDEEKAMKELGLLG